MASYRDVITAERALGARGFPELAETIRTRVTERSASVRLANLTVTLERALVELINTARSCAAPPGGHSELGRSLTQLRVLLRQMTDGSSSWRDELETRLLRERRLRQRGRSRAVVTHMTRASYG